MRILPIVLVCASLSLIAAAQPVSEADAADAAAAASGDLLATNSDAASTNNSSTTAAASAPAPPADNTPAGDNAPTSAGGGASPVAPVPPVATPTAPLTGTFFGRMFKAYANDWSTPASDSGPVPHRGYEAPESDPPFPFTMWPYGGSPVLGQPFQQSAPLMQAIWSGSNGDWWKKSGIQIYGWLNGGFNLSTSTGGGYSNYPAAYAERGDSITLDQEVLYIDKEPDTVQTDHIDWGFRISPIYGLDYRYTTSKGIFSNQLLGENKENGFDIPMAYFDLYIPQVAQGMNIRIGRYISLPDIEAQLAPNNYTYTHSITYTFDCYTQTGINVSTQLSKHWLLQVGLSAGCDAAPWTSDAKATLNGCLGYYFHDGGDEIYACDNTFNNGKYAYNNLTAYYLTWYHKFNDRWHTDTESWYQYEKDTPNVNNPAAQSLLETGANGAYCPQSFDVTCYAPEWAVLNYVEQKLGPRDYMSIRNEVFDDLAGQRTGFKTLYTEHTVGWGHWIGTTFLMRPELRFERSYDVRAYDNGKKQNQFMFACDGIFFF
jgi:Putative beta-barrel porin-2, OmpL-like. bbp2